MKAEIIRGRLIKVDDDKLTIEEQDQSQREFSSRGIDITEGWIRTYLSTWQDWTVIDGVITDIESI